MTTLPMRQRGVTLVVALILLAALSLLAAWSVKSSTSNLRIVSNGQARQAAFTAAEEAVERTLSSSEFIRRPTTVASSPIEVDLDGDGTTDFTAQLSPPPTCLRVRVVSNSELDPAQTEDLACFRSSASQNAGLDTGTVAANDSMCADSEWRLRAVVQDSATGANAAVNQGISARSLATDAANTCS